LPKAKARLRRSGKATQLGKVINCYWRAGGSAGAFHEVLDSFLQNKIRGNEKPIREGK